MWAICLGCNSLIFVGKFIPYHTLKQNAIAHAIEFFFLNTVLLHQLPLYSLNYIRWSPTPFPYVTLNTNESLLGVTNNTMAEMWGIREASVWAWTNSHHRVAPQQGLGGTRRAYMERG
ncbi:hypothetical protein CMV_004038 [Castanea mollissima]|uniref:Uncharacterized protein n=1 Tax=Castanea mollissima TaxID=60419 RepID=A0A8J4RUV9_9ROSI|nr:hypothetical protein CMV_004038 [Castanea mollissima]